MSKITLCKVIYRFCIVLVAFLSFLIVFNKQGIAEEKKIRKSKLKIEDSEFSGNRVTRVTGFGDFVDEKGNSIAKGNLTVVAGRVAVQGIKGIKFNLIPSDNEDELTREWYSDPGKKLARVSLSHSLQWELKDDNFFFLLDFSSGRPKIDRASSFARATEIQVMDAMEIVLWGNKVSIGTKGGIIRVIHGKIVGGKDINIATKKDTTTVYK